MCIGQAGGKAKRSHGLKARVACLQAVWTQAVQGTAGTVQSWLLALEQQARAANSALFPQPEVPPSLSESNDFLKMDSFPPPAAINLLNTKWPLEEASGEFGPVHTL